jgi:predicted MPP superfamily phosphohydrolase
VTRALSGVALLVATGMLAWAGLIEPRRVVVRRATLRLPGWPDGLSGLRVAVVGDLHAGGPHARERRLERVVDRVNREEPDLVALLGDYVDPAIPGVDPLAPERVARLLAALGAPLGVVAVLGNHDWADGGERVAAALRTAGAHVLENEAVSLAASGGVLVVGGVADLRTREPSIEAALPPAPHRDPVLLLTHDPDLFPEVPPNVALTLAGHVHGAQIDVPGLRRLAVPSGFGMRYASGHVEERGRHLWVTRGVGTSGIPLRLRAPAGIDVLELLPEGARGRGGERGRRYGRS